MGNLSAASCAAMGRYWPVPVALWGLVRLAGYLLSRRGRARRGGRATSGIGSREIAVVVLVILSGSAAAVIAGFAENRSLWDLTGDEYRFSEHHEEAVAPNSRIEIANRYGAVRVLRGDADRLSVDAEKTVIAATEDAARAVAEELTVSLVKEAAAYRVVTDFRGRNVPPRRFRVSLTVHVPRSATVTTSE